MDTAILSIQPTISKLAKAYAVEGDIVTWRLTTELTRALISVIDEDILIKDCEVSGFVEEAGPLFEKQDVPEGRDEWPFLGQFGEQDRCFASRGCVFKLGETMFKLKPCGHFACRDHRTNDCRKCTKHGEAAHQIEQEDKDSRKSINEGEDKQGHDTLDKEKVQQQEMPDQKAQNDGAPDQEARDQAAQVKAFEHKLVRIENVECFTPSDFVQSDVVQDLSLFKVKMKTGNTFWFPTADYEKMKLAIAETLAKEEEEEEVQY